MTGNAKHKALIVSPLRPYPPHAGNRRRIEAVCRQLRARGFELHFIWFAQDFAGRVTDHDFRAMAKEFEQFHVVPYVSGIKEAPRLGADRDWQPALEAQIRWCLQNNDYHIMWVNYVLLSRAFECIEHLPTVGVLDTHDILSGRAEMLARNGVGNEFFSLTEEEEARGIARADIVLGIQDEETAFFTGLGQANAMTLQYSATGTALHAGRSGQEDAALTVGIIGSANNIAIECTRRLLVSLANQEAVQSGLLKVRIGGGMSRAFADFSEPWLEVIGAVDDVADFYASVDMIAVPNSFGTGLKIKAVEALSYGMPVASTAHGFLGFNSNDRAHKAADEKALAAELAFVAQNPEELSRLTALTAELFAGYARKVETQMDEVLERASALADGKKPRFTSIRTFDELSDCGSVILYGDGEFGKTLLAQMPKALRRRVVAILDGLKPDDRQAAPPRFHVDSVAGEFSGEETVLLTIHPADWYDICVKLQSLGFDDIRLTHEFAADRLA